MFTVRQAETEDLDALLGLERRVYGSIGTECYTEKHFLAWLRVNPAGLLVAELNGVVVGYKYWQSVHFDFSKLDMFQTYDDATDGGLTARSHRPDGDSMHGVTICSVAPGAGRALFEHSFEQARRLQMRYYVGFTRISGFDRFAESLKDNSSMREYPSEREVALWYVRENVRLVGGKLWKSFPETPDLDLPPLKEKDPALGKQLRFSGFAPVSLLDDCMHDPESRNYAVLMVRELTTT